MICSLMPNGALYEVWLSLLDCRQTGRAAKSDERKMWDTCKWNDPRGGIPGYFLVKAITLNLINVVPIPNRLD